MLASFVRFDSVLIERCFQPVTDMILHRLGLDRARTARLCIDAASVAWILSQAGALSAAAMHWYAAASCLHLLLLLLGLLALCSLRALFRRLSVSRGTNPLRTTMLPHRGLLLALLASRLLALGSFAAAADLTMLLFVTCALYLGACASRPPVRRRGPWLAASGTR